MLEKGGSGCRLPLKRPSRKAGVTTGSTGWLWNKMPDMIPRALLISKNAYGEWSWPEEDQTASLQLLMTAMSTASTADSVNPPGQALGCAWVLLTSRTSWDIPSCSGPQPVQGSSPGRVWVWPRSPILRVMLCYSRDPRPLTGRWRPVGTLPAEAWEGPYEAGRVGAGPGTHSVLSRGSLPESTMPAPVATTSSLLATGRHKP